MALITANFFSNSLMRTVNFVAVLPVDKRSFTGEFLRDRNKPFKTLYLLHGVFGSEYDWLSNTRIQSLASDRNLAVIMPAGENKFYNNHADSFDCFGDYVGQELVEVTRSMFHLSDKPEDTYIAGLSMGGYGATVSGLRYPETFGYVGAFSCAYIGDDYPSDPDNHFILQSRSFHESNFGPEENYRGSDNDIYALARELAGSGKDAPRFYMACGESDSLLAANRQFRDHLQNLEISVTYKEAPGAHQWDFWDREIVGFLDWLPLEKKTEAVSSGNVGK